jgi:hypothetical protein
MEITIKILSIIYSAIVLTITGYTTDEYRTDIKEYSFAAIQNFKFALDEIMCKQQPYYVTPGEGLGQIYRLSHACQNVCRDQVMWHSPSDIAKEFPVCKNFPGYAMTNFNPETGNHTGWRECSKLVPVFKDEVKITKDELNQYPVEALVECIHYWDDGTLSHEQVAYLYQRSHDEYQD